MSRAPDPPALAPVPRARPTHLGPQLGRVGRLVRKELSEILRDRRTVLTLVLMPVLLYPLLMIAFNQFLLSQKIGQGQKVYRLGFRSEEESDYIRAYLEIGRAVLARSGPAPQPPPRGPGLDAPDQPGAPALPNLEPTVLDDLEEGVLKGGIDVGLRARSPIQTPVGPGRDLAQDWEVLYREESATSREALRYLRECCSAANGRFLYSRLRQLGVRQRDEPVRLLPEAVMNPEARKGSVLAVLVPLILTLMTITGAVYPAIDLTAGERERGTLEILAAAPVPRLSVLFAKYVAVLTVALLTALVNLGTMTVTLLTSGVGKALLGPEAASPLVFLQVLGLLILFAGFFSAVLLALTSFARSFKEAQAYLIPLMLLALAPGMLSLVPGLKLEGPLVVVPLVNIVLLARDILEGSARIGPALVVILATVLYALAAIGLAARLFGAEAVLYSQQGSWSDLFRRPSEPRPAATPSAALLCLALVFPAFFFVSGALGQVEDLSLPGRVAASVAVSTILFAGIPLFAGWMGRVRWSTGFRLRPAPAGAYLFALLLGLSLWPFVHELLLWLRAAGLTSLSQEQMEYLARTTEQLRALSPALVLLGFAVVPAVVEELAFRGFLLSALDPARRPATAILGSALLFGLFHLIDSRLVALERLVPTTLLGVVLGWVCWKVGSVFPGMVLHAAHNGSLLMLGYYEQDLRARGWLTSAEDHLPWPWFLAAILGTAAGVWGIRRSRSDSITDPPLPSGERGQGEG